MTNKKYFNISLSYDMIAQAYQNNESYDSACFLLGPTSNNLSTGYEINNTDNSEILNNG